MALDLLMNNSANFSLYIRYDFSALNSGLRALGCGGGLVYIARIGGCFFVGRAKTKTRGYQRYQMGLLDDSKTVSEVLVFTSFKCVRC